MTMRGDGPAPESAGFRVVKNDAVLDQLIDVDTKLITMANGLGLNERPVWVREGESGYLLASGLLDSVGYMVTPNKEVPAFMEYSGYSVDNPDDIGRQSPRKAIQ